MTTSLIRRVPEFAGVRALVVGDLILDRYWLGDSDRLSPEAPVPVVRRTQEEHRIGGAGNVAMGIEALGGAATIHGTLGADEEGVLLEQLLEGAGLRSLLVRDPSRRTVTKLRVLVQQQQLLRLDSEDAAQPFSDAIETDLSAELQSAMDSANVVLISDYGKGGMPSAAAVVREARLRDKPVLVDPWSAPHGSFEAYRGATLITPNEREFERVVGECSSDQELGQCAAEMARGLELQGVLVTRGSNGMLLVPARGEPLALPARAREVYDVTGAGDTVLAVMGASLAAGADLATATDWANRAAGVAVGKLGTATVSSAEIATALGPGAAVPFLLGEELEAWVQSARVRGQSVVMTNGCFDVLHAGHVVYLEQAARCGGQLLVAVNDDASVARLKGQGRPANKLEHRIRVLQAVRGVSAVTVFSEDTPEALIRRLKPEVLVKGGDLELAEVVGGDFVRGYGGRVEVMDFVEGLSTTALLTKGASVDSSQG